MSREALREALEAVTTWPRIPQVHFTGGEPFLFFRLLLQGVQMAAALGMTSYVETSAHWCLDRTDAVKRFQSLQEAGLHAVLISCSPFHAEKIPPLRTMNAVHAALEVFGSEGVIVYLPDFLRVIQAFDLDRPTPLSRYEEQYGVEGARRILWQGYGIISGGRSGYELGHLAPRRGAEAFAQATCALDILYAHHSHLDLYGNYISGFCGGLSVGDWHDLSQLRLDFSQGRYPPLIKILVEQGPCGLLELARASYGYQPLPEGYAGKCHLCVDVRRHLFQTARFAELRPSGFYANF